MRTRDKVLCAARTSGDELTLDQVAHTYRRLYGYRTQPTNASISQVLRASGQYEIEQENKTTVYRRL